MDSKVWSRLDLGNDIIHVGVNVRSIRRRFVMSVVGEDLGDALEVWIGCFVIVGGFDGSLWYGVL